MTETPAIEQEIRAFAEHYRYDAGYLLELLDASEGAFAAFRSAQGMSAFREALPLDAHFVARVVTMQVEDCGACAQLNLRMAQEAGVERELLSAVLEAPERLPARLRDLREHVLEVCAGADADEERGARLRAEYGEAAFAELAVVITGSRIYPTLKRALLKNQSCAILSLDA